MARNADSGPLRTVIFDWDGTLLDSSTAPTPNAYLNMFRALKIPWDLADLKRQYSPDRHPRLPRRWHLPGTRWAEADKLLARQFYRQ